LHDVVVLCEPDILDCCGMILNLGNDMDVFKVGGMNRRNSGNHKAAGTQLDKDLIDAPELGFDDPFRARVLRGKACDPATRPLRTAGAPSRTTSLRSA